MRQLVCLICAKKVNNFQDLYTTSSGGKIHMGCVNIKMDATKLYFLLNDINKNIKFKQERLPVPSPSSS